MLIVFETFLLQGNIYTSSNTLLTQQSQMSLKNSGAKQDSIPIAHTALNSLPPIGGLPAVGQGQGASQAQKTGGGASSASVASSQANAQKRRKKYRMNNYPQAGQVSSKHIVCVRVFVCVCVCVCVCGWDGRDGLCEYVFAAGKV